MTAKDLVELLGGGIRAELILCQLFNCGAVGFDDDMNLRFTDARASQRRLSKAAQERRK